MKNKVIARILSVLLVFSVFIIPSSVNAAPKNDLKSKAGYLQDAAKNWKKTAKEYVSTLIKPKVKNIKNTKNNTKKANNSLKKGFSLDGVDFKI